MNILMPSTTLICFWFARTMILDSCGAGTADAMYYFLKYVTKVQNEIQSLQALLLLSCDRRKAKEIEMNHIGEENSPVAVGRARVNSMAVSLSKKQENTAPICALSLRRSSAFFLSNKCAPLLLAQAMRIVQNTEYEVNLVQNAAGQYIGSKQYFDFLYSYEALQNLNLMKFVVHVTIVKNISKTQETAISEDANQIQWFERRFFLYKMFIRYRKHIFFNEKIYPSYQI